MQTASSSLNQKAKACGDLPGPSSSLSHKLGPAPGELEISRLSQVRGCAERAVRCRCPTSPGASKANHLPSQPEGQKTTKPSHLSEKVSKPLKTRCLSPAKERLCALTPPCHGKKEKIRKNRCSAPVCHIDENDESVGSWIYCMSIS